MLARHVLTLIQCMSVPAGDVVAIEIADPTLAIPAMLGVAMARAAWVHVDPRMPAARRAQILNDAAPSLVLVDGMIEHAYDDAPSRRYVRIYPRASQCTATADVAPSQNAYLLYTSGSTGRPKGVLQSHDNLARHIAEYVRRVRLADDDRIALLAPLDTDAALMDVFGSLCAGACLHVYPLRDAGVATLPQWLEEQRITVVHATPTVLRALTAAHDTRARIASVTRVVMGGELADWRDVERSRRTFGDGVEVFNGYGPTECTMITQAVFAPDAPLGAGTLPIGRLDALRELTAGRRAPLALRLVGIDARRSLLLIVANHLSVDGLSLRILMRELASEYARADGSARTAARSRAPQYSAFVADQRAWRRTDACRQALEWWTHRLRHAEPLDLRGAMSAGGKPDSHARRHTFAIDADLLDALRAHCRAQASTIHTVFLAGFGLLLSRYCRRTDVCIAVPVANRHSSDFDKAAGVFVNTIVMRQHIDESQPAAALLCHAADVTLDALDRQRVPFADVISALGLNGRLSKPLAEAMLVVQRFGPPRFEAEGIHSTDLAIPPATLMSDLCLTVDETDDGVVCHFDHDAGLFDADLVRRMAGHLSNLLRGLLQHPDATVRGLEMLSAAETEALAAGIGATTAPWPNKRPIVDAFVEQARRTPDAIAVVAGGMTYCYRQVDQASTAIAARIRHRQSGRGRLIPLITERRETLPILLLAILKSGHAFVPIDANWPPARIAGALGRCDAEVVVVDPDSPHLSTLCTRSPIALTDADADAPADQDLPLPQYDPEAPIYGIFTSGSTGEPKLPLIAHRGIDNRFAWMTEVFSVDAPPTTLATTPHIFDSAVWQYLWPLTLGGKVVVPADSPLVDADDMLALIDRHGITMADFVPSLFDRMVDQLERRGAQTPRLDRLKFLVLGGEALRIDSVRRFRAIAPRVCIVNLYGPTEASIGCVYNVVDPSLERQPIGKPIPNCLALILDDERRLLPRGVAGHLHLAGVCVGLGYRDAPEQSAASFIANPFPHAPGAARLYRTGDLARFGADDSLDYLGRADNQINRAAKPTA